MDLFTIPFISSATDAGIALTFHFPAPLFSTQTPLPLGIDTWSPTLSTSLSPLSPFCTCYTCKTHHLAFIQHLLSAKEMLGWVLLQIHNHHIISQFFTAIRISIADGRFEEECKTFARMWESELPEKTGQGPRVRGYHYKSEGPGEGKKNKAAWGELGGERGAEGKIVDKGLVPDQPGDELQEKGFAEKVAESV
jgi:queuine tRNA-ribosyltransferase subunit QTRTD1